MMTIDETLEFADKIYDLSYALEDGFVDAQGRSHTYLLDRDHPVHDCVSNLLRAYSVLRDYALGFKEMQFAQ